VFQFSARANVSPVVAAMTMRQGACAGVGRCRCSACPWMSRCRTDGLWAYSDIHTPGCEAEKDLCFFFFFLPFFASVPGERARCANGDCVSFEPLFEPLRPSRLQAFNNLRLFPQKNDKKSCKKVGVVPLLQSRANTHTRSRARRLRRR
jgi:hypothetical protein